MVYSFCLAFKGPHPHRRFQVSRRPFCPLRPGAVRRESSLRCDLFSAWCTPSALRSKDHIRTDDFKFLADLFAPFDLAQCVENLLFAVTFSRHGVLLLPCVQRTTSAPTISSFSPTFLPPSTWRSA